MAARRLKVAVFSTGDELVALDAETDLLAGMLFDSNRHSLRAALTRLGVEVMDFGIVPDDADATREVFDRAAECADAIAAAGLGQ